MKRIFTFAIIACLTLAVISGCSVEIQQVTDPGTQTDPPPPSGGESPAPETSPAPADTLEPNLPVLDKTATDELVEFYLKIPSAWSYHTEPDYEDEDETILVIDCSHGEIHMWGHQVFLGQDISEDEYRDLLKNDEGFSVEDFSFADGGKGYCRKTETYTDFVNITDSGVFFFSINHGGDTAWYQDNEALLFAVAETLSMRVNGA
ncbi:MAG: hypothetical protein FWE59_00415 [Oscillospiraceae bacterium]|nr:hypothetical protein [Oscillospiraceae bacterium]